MPFIYNAVINIFIMSDEIVLKFRKNGPILVVKNGKVAMALCRCGNSIKKPYCSGAHQEVGFEADAAEIEL
jgi:CDGSH-type Zn-finger protein